MVGSTLAPLHALVEDAPIGRRLLRGAVFVIAIPIFVVTIAWVLMLMFVVAIVKEGQDAER